MKSCTMKKHSNWTFCFILLTCLLHTAYGQQAAIPASKNAIVVIAHRGNHTNAQENTLAAYQNAINAGADYVEMDLRTSKDSQLIIMHDGTVNRMTNGTGKVSELTWAAMQQMTVVDKNHPEWPEQSIPLFRDVLKLCKGKINIYLDFKDANVQSTYEALKQAGMLQSVIVYINAAHQYAAWKSIAPQIPLMVSLPDSVQRETQLISFLDQYDISLLDGSLDEYNPVIVQAATARNIQVWPDVQSANEGPEIWETAINRGYTGLQTDQPDALVRFLKNKKQGK
jgi:glycerophosphoryl diester phosphodiesterase